MTALRTPGLSIPAARLRAQGLTSPATSAAEVVGALVAVQAQDLAAARWAVGLRLRGQAAEAHVTEALAAGAVLRTHLLRGTWHLVAPADLRWLSALLGPRLVAMAGKRDARLGFDAGLFDRSRAILEEALAGGRSLTREEVAETLKRAGVSVAGPALSHVLQQVELQGVLCSGPPRDGRETFALVEERAPRARPPLPRDEALAELALRFFRSRGPATVDDLAWWAGLTLKDARAGLAEVRGSLASETRDGQTLWFDAGAAAGPAKGGVHLLPAFDEYLVSYKDRSAVLSPEHTARLNAGGGMLRPALVVDGRVVGTWRRTLERGEVQVALAPFAPLSARREKAILAAARRYGRFLGRRVSPAR